jgi:hypothetical protein
MKASFYLTWFAAEGDEFVGEEKLSSLTPAKVKKWFWLNDTHFGCLIVRASQRHHLQKLTQHQIDLNKYDYFVEHLAG